MIENRRRLVTALEPLPIESRCEFTGHAVAAAANGLVPLVNIKHDAEPSVAPLLLKYDQPEAQVAEGEGLTV